MILADAMTLAGGTIQTGAGPSTAGLVILGPATMTNTVALGSAGGAGTLGLRTADLATIKAGVLQIGYRDANGDASLTGNINLAGPVSLDTANLRELLLVTGGGMSQSPGAAIIHTGGTPLRLGIIASGTVDLSRATNGVDTLAAYVDGNTPDFRFTNGLALAIGALARTQFGVGLDADGFPIPSAMGGAAANPLSGITTVGDGTVAILNSDAAAGIAIGANIDAGSGGTVALQAGAAGTIVETAGAFITAGNLAVSGVFAPITLTDANLVSTLASGGAPTTLSFTNAMPLTVGTVTAPLLGTVTGISGANNVALATTGSGSNLTLAANIALSGSTLTLTASGNITQTGGAITTTNLIALAQAATATIGLTSAGNSVSGNVTLTTLDSAGTALGNANIGFVDSVGFAIAGIAGGGIGGFETGIGTVATASLEAGGPIGETGIITAGTFTGSSVTGAALNGANMVATFGPFANTGGGLLSFTDARPLTTAGSISSTGGLTLTTTASGLTLGGAVTASGTVTLNSAGAIIEGGNVITAALLTGNSVGGANLNGANRVTAIGPFANTGSGLLSFSNAQSLAIGGTLSSAGALTLETTVGDLNLGGNVSAPGQTVNLMSAGAITQSSGLITGLTLTGATDGAVTLAGANLVDRLGPFSTGATGSFSLINAQSLAVTANVFTGGDLSVVTTGAGSNLTLAARLFAADHIVTLASAGTITQTGGFITAATLTGASVGGANLNGANLVGTLGAFANATSGMLSFTDAQSLATSGIVSSAGNLTLTTTGAGSNLILGGAVTASGNTVTLSSAGTIAQTGGFITAATLNGGSVGGAALTGANRVATFGGFANTGGGDLLFTGAQSLTIAGTVSTPGNMILTTTAARAQFRLPAICRPALSEIC